jgi:hypothetical protein
MAISPDDFWKNEYGNRDSAKDFAGRTVKRNDYLGNFKQGQKIPATAWDFDDIEPLNPNGSEKHKKQHDLVSNYQVANVATNREKANKTSFTINDIQYQVVKNTPKHTQGKRLALYNYSEKKHCIVIMDN